MATVPKPAVRAAVAALDLFGAVTQHQARVMLSMWARRGELTNPDVESIVACYPERLADAPGLQQPGRHATFDYQRDDEEPAGGPLPTGIEGFGATGRDR